MERDARPSAPDRPAGTLGLTRRASAVSPAWAGPLATAATVLAIVAARQWITISSPGLILIVLVAISGVLAGAGPALVSAAIASAFVVVDASAPGQLFVYDSSALSRLILNTASTVVTALLVGGIQQRLQAQRELVASQRSEDRQRALTDPASEAIITIDTESRIVAANPATAALFGYSLDELIGSPITKLMPPAYRPRHLEAFDHYQRTGRRTIPWQGAELEAMDATGRTFPIEVSIGEYHTGSEWRFTGIVRDISRRKAIEAQLIQAQKMDAIGRLAGGVAHDFNNLLTAIGGYAELVAGGLPEDDPRQEHVAGIRKATDNATALTRQLLAFSRSQELRPSIVDVNHVVDAVAPMLRRLLGERVELVVRTSDEPCRTKVDRSQFEAVLVNLAVNARDAMPSGGTLTMETENVVLDEAYRIRHSVVEPGDYVALVVTDTGSGMDEETLSHVFEPFFTTKSQGSGTGLGLATVYGTVKQSDGYVWAYSEPGRGTTFKVYLPRALEPAAAGESEPMPAPSQPAAIGHQTILVAEDEAVVREMVVAALERLGYRVVAASTGEEAVRLIDRLGEEIDLLLSDVIMPGMSGPELYERARRTRPDLRAIFMSGYTALAMGRPIPDGVTLLEKPFSGSRLSEVVRATLNGT